MNLKNSLISLNNLIKKKQANFHYNFQKGMGGADVGPLLAYGTTVAGLLPDSQRYFDYHHTRIDSIDKVNKRELELGAAAMAALVYLVDQHEL